MIYNSTALKKLRGRIMAALKKADMEFPKHYSLSGINQIAPTFTFSIILRSPQQQTITHKQMLVK